MNESGYEDQQTEDRETFFRAQIFFCLSAAAQKSSIAAALNQAIREGVR